MTTEAGKMSSLTLRSAALASALALVFLTIVAVPIVFFSLLNNAPSPIVEAHTVLWKIYFLPTEVMSNWSWIDHALILNSPGPAIALIPLFVFLFVLWALSFFAVIAAYKTVRRAA